MEDVVDTARQTGRARGPGRGAGRGSDNLTRSDWIAAAWEMLGESGVEGVRVEPLAKKLGVTKGSFYWHFKGRQDLLDSLLDRWFSIWDERLVSDVQAAASPADKIWGLFRSVIGRASRGQTVSLRIWSHRNPEVARRIDERDTARLAFLTEQLQSIGYSADEARVRGQVYQAIMTGEYLRSGGLPMSERLERARQYHEMLSRPPGG